MKSVLKKFVNKYKTASIEVKASLSYTICSILQKSLSLITLPLFTRLLTTEQYGQTTVYNSWNSFLTLFITLYLAYGSFSTAMIKFENERGKYISAINGLCTLLASIFLLVYIPLQKYFNYVFEMPTIMILVMVMSIVCSNSLECWLGKERFEYKYKSVIAVTLIMTILTPVLSFVFVMLSEEKGYARIVGSALVKISFGLVCYLSFFVKERTLYDKTFWKYALSFNIPLIPYYLSQSIFNQSDRIMISHIEGTDKAAIYGVAYSLATLLTFVLNSVNNSYVPWFYKRIKNGDRTKNKSVSAGIAIIMAVLLLGVIALTPEIILILASARYMEAIWVVPPVAMSLLFLFYTQLFINVEFYFEEKKCLVYGTILSAALNIVLNVILIPIFGFIAAAYTTLLSYIVFVLMHYKMYKNILDKNNLTDDMFDYKMLIIIAVIFMGIGFLLMFLYKTTIIRYVVIICALIIVFFNRNKVLEIYKRIKMGDAK